MKIAMRAKIAAMGQFDSLTHSQITPFAPRLASRNCQSAAREHSFLDFGSAKMYWMPYRTLRSGISLQVSAFAGLVESGFSAG
jgi:hypothetical protein